MTPSEPPDRPAPVDRPLIAVQRGLLDDRHYQVLEEDGVVLACDTDDADDVPELVRGPAVVLVSPDTSSADAAAFARLAGRLGAHLVALPAGPVTPEEVRDLVARAIEMPRPSPRAAAPTEPPLVLLVGADAELEQRCRAAAERFDAVLQVSDAERLAADVASRPPIAIWVTEDEHAPEARIFDALAESVRAHLVVLPRVGIGDAVLESAMRRTLTPR